MSPDARTVYLAGKLGGIAILARDRRTGRLRQLRGRAGCVRSDGGAGCSRVRTLGRPTAIGLSRDGRSLYVAVSGGIVGFARNPRTGALRALSGEGGCVVAGRPGCAPLQGVSSSTALGVAPDGRTVYLAGESPSDPTGQSGGVAVLRRDPATGRLTQLPGAAGCVSVGGAGGCTSASCLQTLTKLAFSPDGTQLYSASSDSLNVELTSPGAVATFARSPVDGSLGLIGCVQRQDAVSDLVVARASSSAYVATVFGDRGTGITRGADIDLYRPASTGALERRRLACIASRGRGCPIPFGVAQLAMTPDGGTLYASEFSGGLTVLRVTRTGLARLPGREGCIFSVSYYMPPTGCARSGPATADAMAVSPDGRSLYVTTSGNGSGSNYAGGVTVFAVQR